MKYLTFALAKGRLAKKSLALFEQIGISMDEMKDPDTRKLIFVNEDLKIKMFLAKASDVPTYVNMVQQILVWWAKIHCWKKDAVCTRCWIWDSVSAECVSVVLSQRPSIFNIRS